MQIKISGKGIEMTEALKQYVEKKIEKIEHFFNNIQEIHVELEVDKIREETKRQVAKATVWASGITLHATEAASSMYASIDMIIDNLDSQIKKFKDKLIHEKRRNSAKEKQITRNNAQIESVE